MKKICIRVWIEGGWIGSVIDPSSGDDHPTRLPALARMPTRLTARGIPERDPKFRAKLEASGGDDDSEEGEMCRMGDRIDDPRARVSERLSEWWDGGGWHGIAAVCRRRRRATNENFCHLRRRQKGPPIQFDRDDRTMNDSGRRAGGHAWALGSVSGSQLLKISSRKRLTEKRHHGSWHFYRRRNRKVNMSGQ